MAMLIPEQISILRKKRDELLEKLVDPTKDCDFRSIQSMEQTINKIDYNQSVQIMKDWKEINDILVHNDFLKAFDLDTVTIGTKFLVQLKDMKGNIIVKNMTLIDKDFSTKLEDVVSLDSPIGREINKKGEYDTFSYTDDSSKKIYGQILSIIKDPNMYLKFLRKDGENVVETNLTKSQKLLLQEESARLRNLSNNLDRIQFINQLLIDSKTIQSNSDVLNVGSEFKIHYYGSDTDKTYELINKAVTDELEDSFIEKDSYLGKRLLGLSNNERFSIEMDNGTRDGLVYDIKVKR